MAIDKTMSFKVEKDKSIRAKEILKEVYQALVEKGYNPINQIVGYILSGDPTYITSHNDARNLIRLIERDELLEKMVKYYIGLEDNTEAINKLFDNLRKYDIPMNMLHQYMPLQYNKVRDGIITKDPKDLAIDGILEFMHDYEYATNII